MSKFSASALGQVLKTMVSHLALNAQDLAVLHEQIDAVLPTAAAVGLGAVSPAEGIQAAVLPLLEHTFSNMEQKLVGYVENRIAGVPTVDAMPDIAVVPATPDPSLVPTAPTSEVLEAVANQPAPGLAAPVVAVDPVQTVVAAPEGATVIAAVDSPTGQQQVVTSTGEVKTSEVIATAVETAPPVVTNGDIVQWERKGYLFNPETGERLDYSVLKEADAAAAAPPVVL